MKKEIINLNSHFWLPYNSVSSSFVYKFRDEVALWLPAKVSVVCNRRKVAGV